MSDSNIQAHIRPIEGKVIVTFPQPISYLAMPPEQAEEFANLLIETARVAKASNERHAGTKPS